MTGESDPDHEDTESSLRETIETLANFDSLVKRSNEEAVELPVLLGMTLVGPSLEDVMGYGDNTGKQLKSRQLPGPPRQRPGAILDVTPPTLNPGVSAKKVAATMGGIKKADKPTAPNSAGLDIEANDRGYLVSVQIGKGSANLLVDTGSADLWIKFKPPTTTPASGPSFTVTYLTGEFVQGNQTNQSVTVAGLHLPQYTLGIATEFERFANLPDIDGVMGLARTIAPQNPTLVEALVGAKQLSQGITAYKISSVDNDANDGEITFGRTDPTKFVSKTDVTLPNINTKGLWEVKLTDITVDGKGLPPSPVPRSAIIDTGSTFVMAPMKDAMAIHNRIPKAFYCNNGIFYVPCTTTANVQIVLEGIKFQPAISPKDLAYAPLNVAKPTGWCLSGIRGNTLPGLERNQWIFGDVFLKNVYFWTDSGNNRVGFAQPVKPQTTPKLG